MFKSSSDSDFLMKLSYTQIIAFLFYWGLF